MTLEADGWAALALWAGQHGLALYVASLALLLMATGLAAWWWGRPAAVAASNPASIFASIPASAGPAAPARHAGRHAGRHPVAIGLAVMALSAGLFSAIAWHLGTNGSLHAADGVFLLALQAGVSPAARQVFAGLTHAADTATLTALCSAGAIILVLCRQHLLAAGWVLAIAGNGLLNTSLKQTFGRVRPALLEGFLAAPGLSFPSGHSSGAVVAYGMAAYLALRLLPARWHLPALLLAVALAFSVGASRVVLQVHFASDVLAGFASGSAWLALCISGLAAARQAGLSRQAPSPAPP